MRFFFAYNVVRKNIGEVAEWSNAHAWKACVLATVPWVRIPSSPPGIKKMKHTYSVHGMTCESCAHHIKETLESSAFIKKAVVKFSQKSVTITTTKKISVTDLNNLIKGLKRYKIEEKIPTISNTQLPAKSIGTYWPLILIVLYLISTTLHFGWIRGDYNLLMTQISPSFEPKNLMLDFMGCFFMGFAFFKLLDLKGFAASYRSYDLPTKLWPTWGYMYPFIELALGMMYLHRFELPLANILTIIILGVSIIGVIQSVLAKRKIKCACLGTGFNLPMSTVTIIEDSLMILMALVLLITS